MQVSKTGVRSVDTLYEVKFTGNIIPNPWYSTIRTEKGKPDLTAITILSEILYWHRPREECDQSDAGGIKLIKRFKADLLQMSYKHLEDKFGLTKDQSRRAIERLEKLGLVKRHFRTVETDNATLYNVMYIELFTDRLLEITFPEGYEPPGRKNPTRVSEKTDEVIRNNQAGSAKNPMTNTEITTEITNIDYDSIYQAEIERVREQVDYEALTRDIGSDRGMIDEIVEIIVENNLYGMEPQLINGERIPAPIIRERFRKINSYVVKEVIDSLRSAPRNIVNTRGYIMTALYNASSTYELGLDMEVTRDMFRREASAWEA